MCPCDLPIDCCHGRFSFAVPVHFHLVLIFLAFMFCSDVDLSVLFIGGLGDFLCLEWTPLLPPHLVVTKVISMEMQQLNLSPRMVQFEFFKHTRCIFSGKNLEKTYIIHNFSCPKHTSLSSCFYLC